MTTGGDECFFVILGLPVPGEAHHERLSAAFGTTGSERASANSPTTNGATNVPCGTTMQ
jgi:hypothetical protein